MATFLQRLERACKTHKSLLCVGLDPDPALMPVSDVFQFNRAIVDVTHDLVCAYKPNLAFYEALGLEGLKALEATLKHIRSVAKDVLVIGDGKRGDIESSSAAYAKAFFGKWGFDAATVNAYGGGDSLEPFFTYEDRGIFIWCRSSNRGAKELQDLEVDTEAGAVPFYQSMALKARSWNSRGNVGLVVGATYPKELGALRELCPEMPFLVPGVGAQAGDLKAAVLAGVDHFGRRAIINSSRGILYAEKGPDFAHGARVRASGLRDAINRILDQEGKGWS